ncbi:MAG: response regulator transcription factor [Actinobacteria bacterium]|nr:response regulator transcription factor [Actinomycetota bacterium]
MAARVELSAAVELRPDDAEARFGLGTAQWWLGHVRQAMAEWEQAYGVSIRAGDQVQAVNIAVSLSLLYNANFGNRAASQGWAARAERLAGALGEPVLWGWVLIAKAATCLDPGQAEAHGREARAIAVEAGDGDLELCALSTVGSALVDAGRVDEGTALLDEALAGSLGGEAEMLETVVFTSCVLMQSCHRCADFPRIVQWLQALERFIARYGCPYVNATCRASYGAVLVATGDWRRAEEELQAAFILAGQALPAVRAEALAHLAELRLAEGRVEEAVRLLDGIQDHAVVVPVLAAAQLAHGDVAVAVATAHRRRAAAGTRELEGSRLGEVLGEADLTAGDTDAAAEEGRRLAEAGAASGSRLMTARGERLLGRALVQRGQAPDARRHLETALEGFVSLEMPLEVARTRVALAEAVHGETPEVAVAEARTALGVFEDLGAGRDADAVAAWLRHAGATAARTGPRGLGLLTKRERQLLALLAEGPSNPEMAERLHISRRTVEHHVASILSKLGLRNRTEAAAYATRHLGEDFVSK